MATPSDKDLAHSFCTTRSDAAFADLTARYQRLILAAAYRITKDQGTAEDVLQHCLTYMAAHPGSLAKVEHLGAWLHTIATREAMRINKATSKREALALQSDDATTNPNAPLLDTLDEALKKLRPADRQVVIQHHLEGLSFKEIADRNGGTHVQWQKRCRRSLEKLVQILRHRGVKSSSAALSVTLMAPSTQPTLLGSEALNHITRQTLATTVAPTSAAVSMPFLTTLITMKTAIAISCLCGVLCSVGLTQYEPKTKPPPPPPIPDYYREVQAPDYQSASTNSEIDLTTVIALIDEIDSADEPPSQRLSELRALMFLLPKSLLPQTFEHFTSTTKQHRFRPSVASLFARWAEFDPQEALASSNAHPYFHASARRGTMVTWLAADFPAAAKRLAAEKNPKDIAIVREYVQRRGHTEPIAVALEIDQLAELWEEADQPIFRFHAKQWARTDPEAASDWVSSYYDSRISDEILGELAVKVGRGRGFEGLAIVDKMNDPQKAAEAKNNAILWWAIHGGGYALNPKSPPHRNLSAGFPNDWSMRNIETFSSGYMENWASETTPLLNITSNSQQLAAVTRGVIAGAGHSKPEAALPFIQSLPNEAFSHVETQQALTRFFTIWKQSHPTEANTWINQQTDPALSTFLTQQK